MCENVTCNQPATERVTIHTARRGEITDTIRLCKTHADVVSAKQAFGPGVRQWVTREPLPEPVVTYDAGL